MKSSLSKQTSKEGDPINYLWNVFQDYIEFLKESKIDISLEEIDEIPQWFLEKFVNEKMHSKENNDPMASESNQLHKITKKNNISSSECSTNNEEKGKKLTKRSSKTNKKSHKKRRQNDILLFEKPRNGFKGVLIKEPTSVEPYMISGIRNNLAKSKETTFACQISEINYTSPSPPPKTTRPNKFTSDQQIPTKSLNENFMSSLHSIKVGSEHQAPIPLLSANIKFPRPTAIWKTDNSDDFQGFRNFIFQNYSIKKATPRVMAFYRLCGYSSINAKKVLALGTPKYQEYLKSDQRESRKQ